MSNFKYSSLVLIILLSLHLTSTCKESWLVQGMLDE
jgi:hypothetical protein